jgi:hypothetical protein
MKDSTVATSKERIAKTKKDSYSLISIPVSFSYTFLRTKKINLSVSAGIKFNFFLNGVTYVSNKEGTDLIALKNDFSKLTLSYMANVGIEYKLFNYVNFLAQPTVNYHGSSIQNKSALFVQKPYSVGLNVGLRFFL